MIDQFFKFFYFFYFFKFHFFIFFNFHFFKLLFSFFKLSFSFSFQPIDGAEWRNLFDSPELEWIASNEINPHSFVKSVVTRDTRRFIHRKYCHRPLRLQNGPVLPPGRLLVHERVERWTCPALASESNVVPFHASDPIHAVGPNLSRLRSHCFPAARCRPPSCADYDSQRVT